MNYIIKTIFITFLFFSMFSNVCWANNILCNFIEINCPEINYDDLVLREGIHYEHFSDNPFTGRVIAGKIHQKFLDYYDKGFHLKGLIKNGKKEGIWMYYYDNGGLAEKGIYKNGRREGTWHAYTIVDGNLWKTGNYKEGMKEGIWYTYSIGVEDKNIVRWEINYNKNQKDGTFKRYFGNSKIDLEGKCKDGKKYGDWKKYLFEGGLSYTKNYKDKDVLC